MDKGVQKVLFFTNSEYGQANVHLAIAYELLNRGVEVHVASFPPLKPRIEEFVNIFPNSEEVKELLEFHTINTTPLIQRHRDRNITMTHPPGFMGAMRGFYILLDCLVAWEHDEYMDSVSQCMEVIKNVNADAIVIDTVFSPGIDACTRLDKNYICLNPISPRHMAGHMQSWFEIIFRLSCMHTGYRYPLPLHLVVPNFIVNCFYAWVLLRSAKLKELKSQRNKIGLKTYPSLRLYNSKIEYLVPTMPGIEFPMVLPQNITECGPILMPSPKQLDNGEEIYDWLSRAPTVMINLGTLAKFDVPYVHQMALGIKSALEKHPRTQILWKIKLDKDMQVAVENIIWYYMNSERVRIEKWLEMEPFSLLQTGHIICSVHHGGANSFFEATWAGIPQVVLPVWWDTYDFAVRVEWLGIGVFGNRKAAPKVKASEFGKALNQVLDAVAENGKMMQAVRTKAAICQSQVGRKVAAEKILSLIDDSHA